MKEIDPTSLALMRYFATNRTALFKKHRLYVLVLWVGGSKAEAKRLVEEKKLADVNLGVVAGDEKTLRAWRIPPGTRNTLVFINKGKATSVLTDVKRDDIPALEGRLKKLLGRSGVVQGS